MKAPRFILIALVLLLSAGVVAAATTTGTKRRARPSRTNPEDASQRIDINNISMVVKNTGSFAYDTQNGAAGLEFPKGTGKTAVFAAGLWMGALVNGKVRASAAEYRDDFSPGAILPSGQPDDPSKPEYKVYKLNRVYLTSTGAIDVTTRDAVLADYNAGAVPHGAPVVNVLPDGSLSIIGDQMLWSVFNDVKKAGARNPGIASEVPLGIEVQLTTFAFSRQGPLGNAVFSSYKIINKGTDVLKSAYVSQWSDPDLGGFTDDLVGCDTTLSVGFVYNATNNDAIYGSTPPCVGYDFLQGPKVGGVPLGLASFNKYVNGGGPVDSTQTYNYMQGLNGDGTPLVFNGQPTKFNVSGDPVAGTGFLDSSPSDRRLMLSSGPFDMAPGDTQQVVAGIVIAQGTDRIASVALMKCFDQSVQAAYDAGFNLASPPNNPAATITPRDGEVFIRWDTGSENYNQPPYVWEGYNVYQGASIAGPWTRVATYDRKDNVQTVLDVECDPSSPVPLQKVKAFGTDSGIRYSIDLDQDKVRGGPLNSASTYYYSVTAYSVGLGQFQQVLESPFVPIAVVPQTPPAGVNLNAAGVSPVDHVLLAAAPPGAKISTDVITVDVLDPATMVAANWQVGFKPKGAGTVWYLTRAVGAQVDTVVNNWPNASGDLNFPVVNGIRVSLLSYAAGTLGNVAYVNTGANPTALEGVDRGLIWFGGGGGYAADDLGGTIPSGGPAPNVEVTFTGGAAGQKAYRYVRKTPATGTVYEFQDYVDVPFTVFDLDANQQKNAAFLESEATADGKWDPDASGNGGREVLWVLGSNYSGATPDPFYLDPANSDLLSGTLDLRYELYSKLVDASSVIDSGDKVEFITSIPAGVYDQYSFTTTPPNTFDAGLAKGELGKIRAVPNPYFAHSTYELNRFNRVLKFTHLPAQCTIRLFDLAGDLVRTIDKNDNTSEATWDLNTSHGLPVGSGVYIAHIDAPGVGTATVKLAVFMEKERLNNF